MFKWLYLQYDFGKIGTLDAKGFNMFQCVCCLPAQYPLSDVHGESGIFLLSAHVSVYCLVSRRKRMVHTGCLAKECTKAKAMNARPSRALMSHIDGDFNWVPQFWIFWVDEWMSGDQYWNWKKENWNWTITHVIECDHVNGNILLIKNIEAYTNTTSRACRPRCFFANQKKVRLNNFTKCRISWRRLAPRVHLGGAGS